MNTYYGYRELWRDLPTWWANLRYIAKHKWLVYQEGRKLGLPLKRCLTHDWHKLLPDEFFPYARYWHGGKRPEDEAAFRRAWRRHILRSDHHWECWFQHAWEFPEEMEGHAMLEMVADWKAMGRQFEEDPPAIAWYLRNTQIDLHPKTRTRVERLLGIPRG